MGSEMYENDRRERGEEEVDEKKTEKKHNTGIL